MEYMILWYCNWMGNCTALSQYCKYLGWQIHRMQICWTWFYHESRKRKVQNINMIQDIIYGGRFLVEQEHRNVLLIPYFISAAILIKLEWGCFSFVLYIIFNMTENLIKLAHGQKHNLLFLLLCQYCTLRPSTVFNESKTTL